MKKHQLLWEQLVDHLDREGMLPLQSLRSTPSEIAGQVAKRYGDIRVQRFVWDYYYPRAFGNVNGKLAEGDAEALVLSFRKQMDLRGQLRAAISSDRESVGESTCLVCGVRQVYDEDYQ